MEKKKKGKVKFLSNNLKIIKTKKNNPTPKANKRPIYSLTPWVDFEVTLPNNHCIMPVE